MFSESQIAINDFTSQAFGDQFRLGVKAALFRLEVVRDQIYPFLNHYSESEYPLAAAQLALQYRQSLTNTRFLRSKEDLQELQLALFAIISELPEVEGPDNKIITHLDLAEDLTRYIVATQRSKHEEGVDPETLRGNFTSKLDIIIRSVGLS